MSHAPNPATTHDARMLDLLRAGRPRDAVAELRSLSRCTLCEAARHVTALARRHGLTVPDVIANV